MKSRFKLENLKLSPGDLVPKKGLKGTTRRAGKVKKFIKGPIPFDWITKAAKAKGKTLHVGIALWFLVGVKRSRQVALSRSTLKQFGVGRQASYRALSRLESAGLLSVDRHPGRNPIMTILLTDID